MSAAPGPPECRSCRHFFITHDPRWPYGCRAFGMHSARLPSLDVHAQSGHDCQAFEPREDRSEPPRAAEVDSQA